MSDKALTRAELELTQRVQLFFPAGVIPREVIAKWNGCSKDVLTKRLAEVFGVLPDTLPTANFVRDMAKEGWTLLADARDPWPISVGNLELVSFLMDDDDGIIGGENVAARAVALNANLGQRHAEYLLDHQDEIPEEFRKFYLIFPGTKWRDRSGYGRVPYLYWIGGQWYLLFFWLGHDFYSSDRLLRPRE
jgi:hypothetical protein